MAQHEKHCYPPPEPQTGPSPYRPLQDCHGYFPLGLKAGTAREDTDSPGSACLNLDPVDEDLFPGQGTPSPLLVQVDGEDEWYVDEILDSWTRRRRLEYLVKWTGYEEADWHSAETLNELVAVDDFHRRYPNKPEPLPESER